MGLIDQIFVVTFARYRRELDGARTNLAWIRAVSKVTGFLILPTAAMTFTLVMFIYVLEKSGSPVDHMHWAKITAIVVWLATAFFLQARFTRYLRDPPQLPMEESENDRRTVLWFRVTCIGLFLAMCVVAVFLHAVGLAPRLGF